MGAAATSREGLLLQAEGRYQERLREARGDLATFTELCGKDENGGPIVLAQIHLAWIWHVNYCWSRGLHAGIMAPFGSGKSSALLVPLAAWLIGTNVQRRIKVVSNGDDFAQQRVASAKLLMESPEYRDVFPNVRRGDTWSDHELEVRRAGAAIDPSLHARGVMTKGIGGRADFVLFDDIVDQDNASTLGSRQKVKLRARGPWMSRLDGADARALMVATAWHQDDATHDFMNDPTWCFLIQRVSEDLERYTQEVVNAGADYLTGRP